MSIPVVDDGHDLVAYKRSTYWRLQVKATDNCASASGGRVDIRRGKKRKQKYFADTVDAFVAVHIGTGQVLCVPVAHVAGMSCLHFSSHSQYAGFRALDRVRPHRRRLGLDNN